MNTISPNASPCLDLEADACILLGDLSDIPRHSLIAFAVFALRQTASCAAFNVFKLFRVDHVDKHRTGTGGFRGGRFLDLIRPLL